MQANLASDLVQVFGHEGGYDADPRDRGNWTSGVPGKGQLKGTKFGIASHVYPNLDIKNLTMAQAAEIYGRDYAPKVAYAQQPPGVDFTMLDIGINTGPARATKLEAAELGAPANAPATMLALAANQHPDKPKLIKGINARMLSFYRSLSTFVTYGRGWTARNAKREAWSLKRWYAQGEQKQGGALKDALGADRKEAATKEKTSGTAAGGAVTADAGASGSTQHGDVSSILAQFTVWDWLIVGALAAIAILITIWLINRWWVHRQRRLAIQSVMENDDAPANPGDARNKSRRKIRRAVPRRHSRKRANRKSRC